MNKIQELTSKLYAEGVEKGKEEAKKIIAEARAQEQQILDTANNTAKEIVSSAQKESADIQKHAEAELRLYAAQTSGALKTEITNLLTDKLATTQVKKATEEKGFMQQLIVELVRSWSKNETLTIGVENPEELRSYLASHAKDILDKGLKIETVNGIKSSFTISPEDDSYKVRFGEKELIDFFKEFLRPRIQELLF